MNEATENDLPFLLELWNDLAVMRYAGYPKGKGWSDSDIRAWWEEYRLAHAEFGAADTQFILRLDDTTAIGESHFGPVPDGFCVGDWRKPDGVVCLMGDIKLSPPFWGKGYGTQGMRLIVGFLFENSQCDLLVVPPHRSNPAAFRVYEKAGFVRTGIESWPGHEIMELKRSEYENTR